MLARNVVVVHGCCKGPLDEAWVAQESTEAAEAVGATRAVIRTPYYACALGSVVRQDGHAISLPIECIDPITPQVEEPHDDSDWDLALRERLTDPENANRIAALTGSVGNEVPNLPIDLNGSADVGLLGFWVTAKMTDVHAYLSGGHQPEAKDSVWEAISGAFPRAIQSDYVLIAHSLGSIVCADLMQRGVMPRPSTFVTVGSQLGWSALRSFFGLSPFYLDGHWINLIDVADWSSGFFSGDSTPADNGYGAESYEDLWVTNSHPSNPHDFRGYMQTGEVGDAVVHLL
jgi:hypothetical protein